MQTVSQAWKDTHRQTIVPESFVEISVGMGDPEAQEKAVCSDNGHEHFSQVEMITDEEKKTPFKYVTLEPGLWVLNGTCRIIGGELISVPNYTITLTVIPTGGGNVGGGGEFKRQTSVIVTAVAKNGFRFVAWTENDEIVSRDTAYGFTVKSDRFLTAVFEQIPEMSGVVGLGKVGMAVVGREMV